MYEPCGNKSIKSSVLASLVRYDGRRTRLFSRAEAAMTAGWGKGFSLYGTVLLALPSQKQLPAAQLHIHQLEWSGKGNGKKYETQRDVEGGVLSISTSGTAAANE